MKIFNKTLLAASIFAVVGVANAIPITGSIGFTGAYTPNTGLLATATSINITNAAVTGTPTDSFAGIAEGSPVSFSDFTFDPITVPVNNLWKVGGFSFNLTQMNVVLHDSSFLALSGTGMISSLNVDTFDPTPGTWTFSANTGGDSFTWSSSSSTTKSVPEPAVALLLGTGLVGFGVARKARKARKAA